MRSAVLALACFSVLACVGAGLSSVVHGQDDTAPATAAAPVTEAAATEAPATDAPDDAESPVEVIPEPTAVAEPAASTEVPAAATDAPAATDSAAKPAVEHSTKAHDVVDKTTGGHAAGSGSGGDHGGGGHGHDEADLSHANAGDELSSPAEFRFELAFGTMVVFLLLLLILGKFAWGPISQGLDKREQHIAGMISDAERNARDSEARLRELEARLAAQAEEARQVLSAARREGDLLKDKLVGEAHAAAQLEKDRAVEEIRNAKNVALREIAQKSVNTAVDLATNIIRREVRPDDHSQLIRDSLSTFQSNN